MCLLKFYYGVIEATKVVMNARDPITTSTLQRMIINLTEQYQLVKREEELHVKRARALIQEREYSGFTDTIKLSEPHK